MTAHFPLDEFTVIREKNTVLVMARCGCGNDNCCVTGTVMADEFFTSDGERTERR